MLPEPGSEEWEDMADFMRADLISGMALSKIIDMTRKQFKEQGKDFNEEFKKWKEKKKFQHNMKVKCAWCGADMGVKPCIKEQHDKISHSICKSCKIKTDKEISEYTEVK